ncbi:FG-GAP-like repeat-containing protein [Desulfogranum marinum]|uniref:FG-GAP-like repeat-containing protein n=1 Tax=Desulfogranum marinum TaxID=453220 RepID=UPI0019630CAB|nr:FG-GAP-like repeat-containing protein [Desulfogranum marinum]MBM9513504.1 VCBS repeat-containing protein [Desulfogranum marinum]
MILKVNFPQEEVETFLFLLLKNFIYKCHPLLVVFSIITLLSATLPTLARTEISFTESTEEAGLTYTGPTWGAQWADYDGDGWPDIFVTNHESKVPSLYLNKQDGTFEQLSGSIWDQVPWPYADTHGAGWADYDNDGDQDVVVSCTQGVANRFYINDNGILYESAREYGIAYTESRGRIPLWMDFDNDGILDVYLNSLSRGGAGYAALFQQNTETSFFENVSLLVGFEDHDAVFSMLSDLTGDGILDIITYDGGPRFPSYVYSMTTLPFTEHRDEIFPPDSGYAADAAFADFNGDLFPDLYWVRGGGGEQVAQVTSTKLAANIVSSSCECEKGVTFKSDGKVTILFSVQLSSADHPFYIGSSGLSRETFASYISPDDPRIWGIAPRIPVYLELSSDDSRVYGIYPHEPGIDAGVYVGFDSELNQWQIVSSQSLDETFSCKFIVETDSPITEFTPLNLTMFAPPIDTLYIHNGANLEKQLAQYSGINQHLAGRSVVAGDFDNDMDIDLYVVNSLKVMNTPNILLENDGTGVFTEVTNAGGAAGTTLGAGDHVVTADYNRDGFLDLFLTNGMYPSPFDHLGPIQLFKNNGNSNHWIEIDLVGTTSNRDGIGARLLLTAGNVTQLREQSGGMHKFSQNHKRIHFGLRQNAAIERLEVQWPSGIVQVIENLSADKIIRVVESSGTPQPSMAVVDSARTDIDTATTVDVLANDYDPNGDTLSIFAVQNPTDQGGITSINDNASPDDPSDDFITYTPPVGFSGTDTFTYTVDDDNDGTGTATVTITVKESNTCIPYGEPNYDSATEDGIFLWQEGNIWHLRAVAGFSGWQRYIGSIASDTEFSNVTPVSFDTNDYLDISNSHEIIFDMEMSGPNFDGLDFEFPTGATVYFDVQTKSENNTDLVFIGGKRCPVNQLPYQILGEPNYDPATEDGIFLWKEGNVWHLRGVAGLSGWQRYTGSIESDIKFSSVTPVTFESNDNVDTSDPQSIIFDMQMSGPWYDGLDFEFPAGATVYFDVQSTSGNATDLVFIGGNQTPIDQLPYELPSDSNNLPMASFTADPISGLPPLAVSYDASGSEDQDGSIVSYEWDFGDGTSADSGVNTNHTYDIHGIYNVILNVTDDAGATSTANQIITVELND